VGKRVETVTYVLQKEGSYRLPAIEIAWWDTNARTLRKARLDELGFPVAANPASPPEIALPEDPAATAPPPDPWQPLRDALRRYGPLALGALLGLGILYRVFGSRIHALRARRAAERIQRQESAAAYLAQLEAVARSGAPAEVLAATHRWLDRRGTNGSAARLDEFAQRSGDAELPRLADGVVDAVLERGPSSDGSAQGFVAALVRHAHRNPDRPSLPGSLGPLNPRS
jgi:hypothetical protein